jgi:hypothetical protein
LFDLINLSFDELSGDVVVVKAFESDDGQDLLGLAVVQRRHALAQPAPTHIKDKGNQLHLQ